MNRIKIAFVMILGVLILLPSLAFAWCDNCGSGGCCPCPGQAQCLGSYSSCEEACGLVSRSSSVPTVSTVDPAQQLGAQLGQLGAQMILQALQGPSPQQVAAEQERQREIAAQQAEAARQAAIAEQERQAEIARQKQETHDRLVSEMKSDDGTSYGIQGLPGLYLNNGQSGQQGLQLMKDDDSTSTVNAQMSASPTASNENTAAASSNTTENEGGLPLMKDDDNASSASENSSPVQKQPVTENIPLMKDDENPVSDNSSGQKTVDMSGVPATKAQLQDLQNGNGGPDFDGRTTGNAPLGKVNPDADQSDTSVVDLRGAHTTAVDPTIVDGSSSSLTNINPSQADQALMRHQWEMNINPRYLSDPAVQQNIRNLWTAAWSGDSDADDKLKVIVQDQFKAEGMTPNQIQDFFSKFNDIFDGEFPAPKEWVNKSVTANMLDQGSYIKPDASTLLWEKSAPYYSDKETAATIDPIESIQASHVNYQGNSKQTKDDCVLYAIANGSGVNIEKVRDVFDKSVNNLGMEEIGDRTHPQNMLNSSQQGGRGGTGPIEELLVAEKFGKVIPVPKDSFAKAIANTGQPVITTVKLYPPKGGDHKVVVTGVYENKDGTFYYSVMDSNLYDQKTNASSTNYVEKSFFDAHLSSGGFVVMPNDKQ